MLKTNIIKVKLNENKFAGLYPAGSFRLTLREWTKRISSDIYFNKNIIPENYKRYDIKNFGCYVFGQPDTWKGVLGVSAEYDNEYEITIWVDYRAGESDTGNIIKMLDPVIDALIQEGVIEEADTLI